MQRSVRATSSLPPSPSPTPPGGFTPLQHRAPLQDGNSTGAAHASSGTVGDTGATVAGAGAAAAAAAETVGTVETPDVKPTYMPDGAVGVGAGQGVVLSPGSLPTSPPIEISPPTGTRNSNGPHAAGSSSGGARSPQSGNGAGCAAGGQAAQDLDENGETGAGRANGSSSSSNLDGGSRGQQGANKECSMCGSSPRLAASPRLSCSPRLSSSPRQLPHPPAPPPPSVVERLFGGGLASSVWCGACGYESVRAREGHICCCYCMLCSVVSLQYVVSLWGGGGGCATVCMYDVLIPCVDTVHQPTPFPCACLLYHPIRLERLADQQNKKPPNR